MTERRKNATSAMKIAIVGAGIGGCSTARFCREEFPEAETWSVFNFSVAK